MRSQLRAIAEDTMRIVQSGRYEGPGGEVEVALDQAPWFDQLTFAVHDPRPGRPVYQTFARILK